MEGIFPHSLTCKHLVKSTALLSDPFQNYKKVKTGATCVADFSSVPQPYPKTSLCILVLPFVSEPYTMLLVSLCFYSSQTQRVKTLSCLSNTHHAHTELWDTSMRNSPPFNKHSARQNKPLEHPVIKIAVRESSVLIFAVAGFKAPRLSSLGLVFFHCPDPGIFSFNFLREVLRPPIWAEKS